MNVSLPASLKKWVDARVKRDGFGTASELVRHLIRSELRRDKVRNEIDDLLLEGIASGPGKEKTEDDWESLRRRAREHGAKVRAARRKSA